MKLVTHLPNDSRYEMMLPQELKDRARAKATAEDSELSKVIRRLLREYVKDDGHAAAA